MTFRKGYIFSHRLQPCPQKITARQNPVSKNITSLDVPGWIWREHFLYKLEHIYKCLDIDILADRNQVLLNVPKKVHKNNKIAMPYRTMVLNSTLMTHTAIMRIQ